MEVLHGMRMARHARAPDAALAVGGGVQQRALHVRNRAADHALLMRDLHRKRLVGVHLRSCIALVTPRPAQRPLRAAVPAPAAWALTAACEPTMLGSAHAGENRVRPAQTGLPAGTWGSASRSEERMKKWPWKVEMRRPLLQRMRITACSMASETDRWNSLAAPPDLLPMAHGHGGAVRRPCPLRGEMLLCEMASTHRPCMP